MSPEHIVFIHLSDIHFHKPNTAFDLDIDLRNELERDVVRILQKVNHIDGFLIGGDIAFSGKPEQYRAASDWLARLCALVSCAPEKVYAVPGNHDVDRGVIESNRLIQDIHEKFRGKGIDDYDTLLHQYLGDQGAGLLLLKPLESYNLNFAMRYNCATTPENPFWQKDFPLKGGNYRLRVRGINSALISDASDNNGSNKLIVGTYQALSSNAEGIINMIVCHHPPNWLLDGDKVEGSIIPRITLQLFGHKHHQLLSRIENSLRLTSGAVHPDREEKQWQPRYNCICIRVQNDSLQPQLEVEVWQRVWDESTLTFQAGAHPNLKEFHSYLLPLNPIESKMPDVSKGLSPETKQTKPEKPMLKEVGNASELIPTQDFKRILVYRYLGLPYNIVVEIATSLGLMHEEDQGVGSVELYRRFVFRAENNNQLAELWEAVKGRYPRGEMQNNPFKQTN